MIPLRCEDFTEIWCVDFEFSAPDGERQYVLCMVAQELRTGRVLRLWRDELVALKEAPFPVDRHSLFVAFYASAEMRCFLELGWPFPVFILDLFTEFRNHTNGLPLSCGKGLLGALVFHGLSSIGVEEKKDMRDLALRGEPFQADERLALLGYCESDVDGLIRLLPRMQPRLDLPRALCRGRFMRAAAKIENSGVPLDVDMRHRIMGKWEWIKHTLIQPLDFLNIYDGCSFIERRWQAWVEKNVPEWPRTPTGKLSLKHDVFREMAAQHSTVATYREIRSSLSELRLNDLSVGRDGRNRCLLSAFGSRSGRNTPSNSKFIFGPAAWLRGLIKPSAGRALAILDWSAQEFAIGGVLSKDQAMIESYESGDPYLAFGKQVGAIPQDGTKDTHPVQRSVFKELMLGVNYGMGARSLAAKIHRPECDAQELLRLHRRTYKQYWAWSDAAQDHAMLTGRLYTVFGWQMWVDPNKPPKVRSLRNFPLQSNGSEMLRIACSLATERGVSVVAPIHDAVMVESPTGELNQAIDVTRRAMAEASRAVLDGFEIRTDVRTTIYPERFSDEKGLGMWRKVTGLLDNRDT